MDMQTVYVINSSNTPGVVSLRGCYVPQAVLVSAFPLLFTFLGFYLPNSIVNLAEFIGFLNFFNVKESCLCDVLDSFVWELIHFICIF